MANYEVVGQVKVRTKNSKYLVTSTKIDGKDGYTLRKIEDLSGGKECTYPVGWDYRGFGLHLEIGSYLALGDVITSRVLEISPVDPDH